MDELENKRISEAFVKKTEIGAKMEIFLPVWLLNSIDDLKKGGTPLFYAPWSIA